MPLFLVVHTWKMEDAKVVLRKMLEGSLRAPKGPTLLFRYLDIRQTGSWCICEAEKAEDFEELQKFWADFAPEMHRTDLIPIVQFFPPGADLYRITYFAART